MQKNLYYRQVLRRRNVLLETIQDFFLKIASYPRLLIEVFLRKNFGVRYFSTSAVIIVGLLLLIYPLMSKGVISIFSRSHVSISHTNLLADFGLWYLFAFAFLYFGYRRWLEVRRNPSVFDFAKVSVYAGDIHPFFYQFKIGDRSFSIRSIEIYLEAATFFITGLLLWAIGQSLGTLFVIASVCYSISYGATYKKGDDFCMDMIDDIIFNEEKYKSFVMDAGPENARGCRFYMNKPTDLSEREKLANAMVVMDEISYVS